MTLEETRQLGIEFERRVQTMIPEKEYLDKLDTDTIYAYLNSYQDKYIHDIYRNLDLIKSGSKLSAHVEAVLLEMLRTQTISVNNAKNYTRDITDDNGIVIVENGRSVTYPLDPSFYMYVRSVSNVSSTYAYKNNGDNQPIRVLPNELVSQSDVWRLLETPHNSLRILRYPAATIGAYETFEYPENEIKTRIPIQLTWLDELKIFNCEQLDDQPNEISYSYSLTPADGFFSTGWHSKEKITSSIITGFKLDILNNLLFMKDNTSVTFVLSKTEGSGADVRFYRITKNINHQFDGNYIYVNKTQIPDYINVFGQNKNYGDSQDGEYSIIQEYNGNDTYLEFVESKSTDSKYCLKTVDNSSVYSNGTIKIVKNKGFVTNPTLNVIYDQYTTPVGIKIVYYAQPQHFDIMTSTRCELPMDAFDDIVTGAVDLYVQYVAGAEANKRRIQEAQNRQAKENNKKRNNEDED